MGNLEILAEVASKILVTEDETWKRLRKNGFYRQNAVCGKRTGSRKNKGYYKKMLSYEDDFPSYEKMEKIFKVSRELILLE